MQQGQMKKVNLRVTSIGEDGFTAVLAGTKKELRIAEDDVLTAAYARGGNLVPHGDDASYCVPPRKASSIPSTSCLADTTRRRRTAAGTRRSAARNSHVRQKYE